MPTGLMYGMPGADLSKATMGIKPSLSSAPAGEVTFKVTNDSKDTIHEMIVVDVKEPGKPLPYSAADQRVDEEAAGDPTARSLSSIPASPAPSPSASSPAAIFSSATLPDTMKPACGPSSMLLRSAEPSAGGEVNGRREALHGDDGRREGNRQPAVYRPIHLFRFKGISSCGPVVDPAGSRATPSAVRAHRKTIRTCSAPRRRE